MEGCEDLGVQWFSVSVIGEGALGRGVGSGVCLCNL